MEMQVKYCFVVRLVFINHFSSTYWKRFADSLKNSTKDRAEQPTRNKMEIVKSDDAIKGYVQSWNFQLNIDVGNTSLWSKLCHQSDCVTHSHTTVFLHPRSVMIKRIFSTYCSTPVCSPYLIVE